MKHTMQHGWDVLHYNEGCFSRATEEVANEFPLTILLNGEEFATLVCSPTCMKELVIGILASEGMIRTCEEIHSLHVDEDRGFAYVETVEELGVMQHEHSKRFIGSCCGKSRQFYFKNDVRTAKTVTSKLSITANECFTLMNELQTQSDQFLRTGGVHNAALCTRTELICIRTDIGRHNALDKIYGNILQDRIPLSNKLIVFSGRISSEVLLKIAKIGIGIIVSKAAPTDLALKLANDLGITAVGFVRGNKMNVYTHPWRIVGIVKK